MAVAQEPFESSGNRFATLVPLIWADGTPVNRADFTNNGLVWWKVPDGFQRADPGRLMSGSIEQAPAWDNSPDKSRFQTKYEVTDVPRADELVEIVDIDNPNVTELKNLLARGVSIEMDHAPSAICLVRFNGFLYGPMRANATIDPQKFKRWAVTVSLQDASRVVVQIPEVDVRAEVHSVEHEISLNSTPPERSQQTITCAYTIMFGAAWNRCRTQYPRLVIESDYDVINKVAGTFLTKSKRRQLMALLKELEQHLSAAGMQTPEAEKVLGIINNRLNAQDDLGRLLVSALLESGTLDDKIKEGIEVRAQEYIAANTNKLSAEIDQKLAERNVELSRAEKERDALQDELDRQRRQAKREIDDAWIQHQESCTKEDHRIEEASKNLARMQQEVTERLNEVLQRFAVGKDDLITHFLALSPLLTLSHEQGLRTQTRGVESAGGATTPDSILEMPAFVRNAQGTPQQNRLTEPDFFDRFCNHARNCRMNYRRMDLVSFHLSAKTSGLSILGGLSGTGKSSLPLLYAEALGGDDHAERYLSIGVSPAWLDMRDLLGHVNALERTFEPAESGLYKHLIYAQTEYMNHSQDSGIYMICLDEMNLAHVEHYFSGFLTALEMPQDRKLVPCFDDASVSPASKFARWPLLKLPPSIRFVGTVNLDETTKQISLRVKDRANFIRLRPTDAVQGSASASDQRPRVIGPRVCLRDYRDWEGAYSLDVEMAELIDALDRHLRDLGCPISPRRREAMRRFIAAANPELCSVAEAVDLQIAQRLLPQVRGLFRSEANKSLEAIAALLSKQRHSFQESMQAVDDLRREEFGGTLFSQVATA